MTAGLFDLSEACGCDRWYCKRCNPATVDQVIDGSLDFAADWKIKADAWFDSLSPGARFTSEDLTEEVGFPSGVHAMNRNNAVGAWVRRMVKEHRIARVDFVSSRNVISHGRTILVWQKK